MDRDGKEHRHWHGRPGDRLDQAGVVAEHQGAINGGCFGFVSSRLIYLQIRLPNESIDEDSESDVRSNNLDYRDHRGRWDYQDGRHYKEDLRTDREEA